MIFENYATLGAPLAGRLRGLSGSVGGLGSAGAYARAVAGLFNSVPIESHPCKPTPASQSTTHLTITQYHLYSSQSDRNDNTKDTGMVHVRIYNN